MHLIILTQPDASATRTGVEAVLGTSGAAGAVPIVLARDCDSPVLLQWLRSLEERRAIALHEVPSAGGLGAALNAVIAAHGAADLVLLQDVRALPPRWLERLQACLAREPNIATVSPFLAQSPIAAYGPFAHGEAHDA